LIVRLFELIPAPRAFPPEVIETVPGEPEIVDQALGRSRGGFSCKIHIAVDGLGNPLRYILTAGQVDDSTQGEALIAQLPAQYVLGDKAYDTNALLAVIEAKSAEAVIPSKANRKEPRVHDAHIYKERHLVECFINKIKQFRRVFSRFDKTAKNFLNFLQFVGVLIWLR